MLWQAHGNQTATVGGMITATEAFRSQAGNGSMMMEIPMPKVIILMIKVI